MNHYFKILFYISFIFCLLYISYRFIHRTDKNFVIVIASYNNGKWYHYNLNSIFSQSYPHYRVIYIDDCSSDGTYHLVKEYIESRNLQDKITLIGNTKRQGALANHYKAIHRCKDEEVIVCLDGDDWFAHNNVLRYLNTLYQNPHLWLTYGQFCNWPTGDMGWCEEIPYTVIKHNTFREFGFVSPHLRTYYSWLAKQVKLEDLLLSFDNKCTFFPIAGDVALMFPIILLLFPRFSASAMWQLLLMILKLTLSYKLIQLLSLH